MKKYFYIFFIFTLLLSVVVVTSEAQSIPSIYPSFITAYDIDQGLSLSCINEIEVDRKGRLWLNPCNIFSRDKKIGFYQFDGKKSYEVPIKLSDGTISTATWVIDGITSEGLLYGKDSKSAQALILNPDTHEPTVFSFSAEEAIINLVTEGNSVFALTWAPGVYSIYNLSSNEKKSLATINKSEITGDHILKNIPAVIYDKKIWFLHQNIGFFSVDLARKTFKEYKWEDLLGQNLIKYSEGSEFIKLSVNGNGNLIFFIDEKRSFFLFDTQSEELIPHRILNSELDKIAGFQIQLVSFFSDDQKNILIEIRYDQNPEIEAVDPKASNILLDNKGQLFNYDPVLLELRKKSRFQQIFIRDVFSPNFKEAVMIASGGGLFAVEIQADLSIVSLLEKWPSRAMVQINKDLIWIKGDKKKFGKIDISNKKIVSDNLFDICNKDIDIPTFAKLINRNQQEIWFPTRDGALYVYHIKDHTCTKYPIGQNFHKFDFINENEVAIATLSGELFIYNLEEKVLSPFLHNGQTFNIEGTTNAVYCDGNGVLWIASTGGLWCIDTGSDEITRLDQKEGFEADRYLSILEGEDGILWIGTAATGLKMYNPRSGLIKVIDQKTGLSNNTVVGILSDQDGDIWASTFDGITVLSKEGDVLFEINEKDGISHKEFNRSSFLKTWDGKLIFGTVDGINIIDPVKVKQVYGQKEDLEIYLSEISFFSKQSEEPIILRKNLENIDQIKLPPTHRYLNLNFALSDYLNPDKTSYSYGIQRSTDKDTEKDQDEDFWISLGAKSELTITNLPVGEFTIFIKGSNYKGKWTQQPLTIPVKVMPFFYNTWWFYLLCSVPVVTILFLGYRQLFTEKRRLEVEVSKRTQQIVKDKELIEEQAAKLLELDEMKSRFFTNISHEFRTPLTIISGMIPQMENNPDRWMKKGMELIRRNSNHLLSLINQILDLRKLESGALQANFIQADIIPYLNYIADSFRTVALSKGIKLHILSQKKELIMDYDPDKMMHILSNLLSNALKYTPTEGDIYLQINQTRDDQLQLIVKDTGQGIHKEHLPYIFDRFYQVEDLASQKPQGSGVGLALTKELVNLLNGVIEVDSEWGVGTTFSLFFPITRKARFQEQQSKLDPISNEEMAGEETAATVSSIEKTNTPLPIFNNHPSKLESLPSLLIVEDNPEVRLYLTACLAEDYDLLMAENGQEGIDLAIEKVPDLIVSDVMMPIKDGFELCDRLKNDERTSHIPIILLTAKADFDSKLSGLRKGADAYLTKPFQEEELLVRLEQLLILRNRLHERYKNQLASASLSPSAEHVMEDAFIGKFRQLVMDNIAEEHFGVVQLCRSLGISRSQLHKKVKALTGLSTTSLVRTIRLHKARQLLQTTDLNVSEVGYEVGINNPAYFSRIYSEEFGEAPRETRK